MRAANYTPSNDTSHATPQPGTAQAPSQFEKVPRIALLGLEDFARHGRRRPCRSQGRICGEASPSPTVPTEDGVVVIYFPSQSLDTEYYSPRRGRFPPGKVAFPHGLAPPSRHSAPLSTHSPHPAPALAPIPHRIGLSPRSFSLISQGFSMQESHGPRQGCSILMLAAPTLPQRPGSGRPVGNQARLRSRKLARDPPRVSSF